MWYLGDNRVSEPHDGAPHVVLCPCTPHPTLTLQCDCIWRWTCRGGEVK